MGVHTLGRLRPLPLATAAITALAFALPGPSATAVPEPVPVAPVTDAVRPVEAPPVALGDRLYFLGGTDTALGLWSTDGTRAGTTQVKGLAGVSRARNLLAVGDRLYFTALDRTHAEELWTSDGTAAGTLLVKDIKAGASSSYPHGFAAVGETLYFTADDGTHGDELWTSDGTAAGTTLVKDINPGAAGGVVILSAGHHGDRLLFGGDDGVHGTELWSTDGTPAGTAMVKDIRPGADSAAPSAFTDVAGTLYFSANDGVHGRELWRSDGTLDGTAMVGDLSPGRSSTLISAVVPVGSRLILWSDRGSMWSSDGTAAGSFYLAEAGESTEPVVLDGELYFTSEGGAGGDWELWKSDGTVSGTILVADLLDLGGDPACWYAPMPACHYLENPTLAGGKLYFNMPVANGDAAPSSSLWSSDGTLAGTGPLRKLDGAVVLGDATTAVGFGDATYFLATDRLLMRAGVDRSQHCDGREATIVGSGSIAGTPGDDVIVGSAAVDTINGRGGNDTICAGDGDDLILGGTTSDGGDRILGEGGLDTISYASRAGNVKVDLTTQAAVAGQAGEGDSLLGVENATGGAGNDDLIGNRYRNTLSGGGGNDVLSGAGGNDKEYGGAGDDAFWSGNVNGADLHNGQAGIDTINYSARTTTVVATLGGPTGNDGAPGEGDTLTLIENITSGAGNDTLTGNTSANRFRSGPGNDVLRLRDGITGNDTADGGTGTDTATTDPGDIVVSIP